ncbi:MFS transporter, partial [bacterium]|nr:MFS transporter [bacterium]
PWLLSTIGAPGWMAGWLMPIKQAGSMLPQISVAGAIRGFPVRKHFWFGAGVMQTIMLAVMALSLLFLDNPVALGWIVLGTLLVFSVASGVGSVAFGDVVGKTIPKTRRGRMLGLRATFGGVLTLAAGLWLRFRVKDEGDIGLFVGLIAVAAGLWLLGAVLFVLMKEMPGATKGGRNAISEARHGWKVVQTSGPFRRFLIVRGLLLLGVELAVPYYTVIGKKLLDGGTGNLGLFIIATAVAATVSSVFWGKFADTSARKTMAVAGVLSAVTAMVALGFYAFPSSWVSGWSYAPLFFLIGLAVAGTRTGRKTFVVDLAPEDERPTYVAFSNTFAGVVTILGGLMGFIGYALGWQLMLVVLAALSLIGALVSMTLPEVEQE